MSDINNIQKLPPSERIKDEITKFIFRDNYWGYLFSRINRREDINIPAPMGVCPEIDGTITLVYNPNFINLIEDDFLKIIIEHEGIHVLNDHIPRLLRMISMESNQKIKEEKTRRWNLASDCAVNCLIPGIKIEYKINNVPVTLEFPQKYNLENNKTSEYYYEKIPYQNNNGNGNNQSNKNGNNSDENSESGSNFESVNNIDDHDSWLKNIKKVSDINSLSRRIEQYTETIAQESYDNVRRKGDIPFHITQVINELLKAPQIPYYQMIEKLVKGSRLEKFKRAYTRINKKRVYSFFIDNNKLPSISPFPGKSKNYTFNISILLDTSGSMGIEDIMEGLSSIKNIIENDKYCLTTVIEIDAQIQKEYTVKKIKDIDYKIRGRGGTVLYPGLFRCKELKTDVTLVFTDGYCDNINQINRKLLPRKIIYVLTRDGCSDYIDRTGYIVRLNR